MISLDGSCSDTIRPRYAVAFPGIAHRMAQGRTMPFAADHVARCNLGFSVPSTRYPWGAGVTATTASRP
jgi:hypothetical protein